MKASMVFWDEPKRESSVENTEEYLLKYSVVKAIANIYGVDGHNLKNPNKSSLGLISVGDAVKFSLWEKMRAVHKTLWRIFCGDSFSLTGFVIVLFSALLAVIYKWSNNIDIFVINIFVFAIGAAILFVGVLSAGNLFKFKEVYKVCLGSSLMRVLGGNWAGNINKQEVNLLDMFRLLRIVSGVEFNEKRMDDFLSYRVMKSQGTEWERECLYKLFHEDVNLILKKMLPGGSYYDMVKQDWDVLAQSQEQKDLENSKKHSEKIMNIVMNVNKMKK